MFKRGLCSYICAVWLHTIIIYILQRIYDMMDKEHNSSGLRSPGLLGRKPIIGIAMFVFGSLIFLILAYNLVNNGPLVQWDLPLAEWFHAFALQSSPLLTSIMIAGYYVGNWGVVAVGILLSLYFLYKRFWRELIMTITSLGLSGIIFLILSNIFDSSLQFS